MDSCTSTRRVEVQRCPAVPTAPNRIEGMAMSRSASSIRITALLPPSSRMVLPKRSATVEATVRPTPQEPVKEISGRRRSSSMRWPTSRPEPITREARAPKPSSSRTGRTTLVRPMAQRGVWLEGFHSTASPQARAIMAFQAHTAMGKLKAVTVPQIPRGCHCSRMA